MIVWQRNRQVERPLADRRQRWWWEVHSASDRTHKESCYPVRYQTNLSKISTRLASALTRESIRPALMSDFSVNVLKFCV
jgi:hypothetical protein